MIIKNLSTTAKRAPGRPREFDLNEALDKVSDAFSERGYHATSIDDLTQRTGLVSGSIYRVFKDKRSVFVEALKRYLQVRSGPVGGIIKSGKSGKEKIGDLLKLYADVSHGVHGRRGCLVIAGAVELAVEDKEVCDIVGASFHSTETLLKKLILEGQEDGSIKAPLCPDATSKALLCFLQGIRVIGKVENSRENALKAAIGMLAILE